MVNISVCMATYNGELFIKEQIESILSQLSQNDELIISDDGSTDNTIAIIKSFSDNRINLYFNDKKVFKGKSLSHKYVSSNFENALKYARGNKIILSDQDDIWLPGKVAMMIKKLEEYDVVLCNFKIMSKDETNGQLYFLNNPLNTNIILLLAKMPFFGSAMCFNRNVLKTCLPFPPNLLLHDNWIGFIGLLKGRVGYIDNPLHLYRIHQKNTSFLYKKNNNSFWYKIEYRLIFLFQLLKRVYIF